jgi:putative ABC transport system substrate-binding protein
MLASGLLAAPLAEAQAGQRPRIGYLASHGPPGHVTDAFIGRLRELGYEQGRTVAFEFRWPTAAEDAEQLRELAAGLVSLKVDVLVASGPPATAAALNATRSIPVVMVAVDDPVGRGFAVSLERPGGNATGCTWDVAVETYTGDTLELVKQLLPKRSRVALLWNRDNPAALAYVKAYQDMAPSMGITLLSLGMKRSDQLENAFTQMVEQQVDAVIVGDGHMTGPQRKHIAELATRSRLPTICGWRKWTVTGCLMSYGPYPVDMYRRAADYVDRTLKGAKPGDLPIEQPTKFELVINLKTAKALGLTMPQSLLLRADKVIQ